MEMDRTEISLDAAKAKAIVTEHATALRSHDLSWRLASTHDMESVVFAYDTLVFERPFRRGVAWVSVAAPAIRNALLVWLAVSRCRGFSFQDNLAFWVDALRLRPVINNNRETQPRVSRGFPRIVLFLGKFEKPHYCQFRFWEPATNPQSTPQDTSSVELSDIFTPFTTTVHNRPSAHVLEQLREYRQSRSVDRIECFLRLQFGPTAEKTKCVLECLAAQVQRIVSATTSTISTSTLSLPLTGIELIGRQDEEHCGLEVNHMKALQVLNESLPRSVTFAVRFPGKFNYRRQTTEYRQADARAFGVFVRSMCGFHGIDSFQGRLQVLDLVDAFASRSLAKQLVPNFACLCTLLPFTTTLRELHVRILLQTDLLWLAYAMFHPQSARTKWKMLSIRSAKDQLSTVMDWQAVSRLVGAESPVATLLEMLTTSDSDEEGDAEESSRPEEPVRHTRWTASVIKRATVYDLDRTTQLVVLSKGDQVELCHSPTSTQWAESDDVAVLVPGYGFGFVGKAYLVVMDTVETTELPVSCITAFHVGRNSYFNETEAAISSANQLAMLRVMGPTLQHLRVSQASLFQHCGFSELVPRLETIDCCHFTPEMAIRDLHALPKLRALGIACSESQIDQCFQSLLAHRFVGLRELSLQVVVSCASLQTVEAYVRRLVGHVMRLKILLIPASFDQRNEIHGWQLKGMDVHKGASLRELAFLSVVHHAQTGLGVTSAAAAAIAQLDAHLMRVVFDLCGPGADSVEVVGGEQRMFGSARSPIDTAGDVWSHRN